MLLAEAYNCKTEIDKNVGNFRISLIVWKLIFMVKIFLSCFFFFFFRKLFQSTRIYIKGILNGRPATQCLVWSFWFDVEFCHEQVQQSNNLRRSQWISMNCSLKPVMLQENLDRSIVTFASCKSHIDYCNNSLLQFTL